MVIENLTFEDIQKIGRRFKTDTKIFRKLNQGISKASHGDVLAIFVQSLISFSSEEQLKTFLKKEIFRINKKEISEIFGWKRFEVESTLWNLFTLLDDNKLELNDTETQFIFILGWRLGTEKDNKSICDFLKEFRGMTIETKKNVAVVLSKIDYLDYFNPDECKKILFELSLGV